MSKFVVGLVIFKIMNYLFRKTNFTFKENVEKMMW